MAFPLNVTVASAVRTAVGRANKGALKHTRPDDLAAAAMQAAVDRVDGLDAARIDDVILGCAMPEGEQGLNIARNAVFLTNLPDTVPGETINRFCASGLQAIAHGAQNIQSGTMDVVLAGGTGSQMALTAMLCRGAGQLTKQFSNPEKASRPFDRSRDGMVVGEGAGALVLESAEHAKARGATPLATLGGWSRSYRNANSDDFEAAIGNNYLDALRHSGLTPQSVGLINANASGSIQGDRDEAGAINRVFGSDVPVVAHKSNFGNVGPGTSMLELIGGVLSKQFGVCPGTINCENLDPDFKINVQSRTTHLQSDVILKSSFSSTGQIASIVLR